MSRREEFINGLKRELGHLPYNEVEKVISFFEESIEDKFEEGLSEDEIFNQYGSYKDVAKEIKEDPSLKSNNGDRKEYKGTDTRERFLKEYVFDKTYKNINLSDKNIGIVVKPSEDDKVHLKVYENDNCFYQISDDDDLSIKYVETSESIYQSIFASFFNSYNYTTELYIPMKSNDTNISVSNKNGSINISDLVINNLVVLNKNGGVKISTIRGRDIKITNTNGSIGFDTCACNVIEINGKNGKLETFGIACEGLDVTNKNGAISCNDIGCGYISLENINGKIEVSDLVSRSSVLLKNTAGKIEFNNVMFETEMRVYNSAGKVEGSLNHRESDLSVSFTNANGSNHFNNKKYSSVEKLGMGEKIFSAINKAGSIKVTTLK